MSNDPRFLLLQTIIAEEMDMDPQEVNEEQYLSDDLEMDKTSIMQVLTACEVEFGVEFDSDDLEDIKTVADIYSYINEDYMA